jgi:ribonuclease HI
MAEYEAFINRLYIVTEVGARCLLMMGNSKLVIDQVIKEVEPCEPWMHVYRNKVCKLEEKFKGFEIHHNYRCFNAEADQVLTIASR